MPTDSEVNYFTSPNKLDNKALAKFFKFHPHQQKQNIPFDERIAYRRKDGTIHMWVTFRPENHVIFRRLCLVYADANLPGSHSFIKGNSDRTHLYSHRRT